MIDKVNGLSILMEEESEEARVEIEEIFNLIAEVIATDEEVKFKNKGTFSLLKRKKRIIRSPTSK
ncbi:MAG: HU family DNA-binding protein [Fusobacterium varium]|uniref:HU family DNA-binding protein n=1 Tax=Fusobacterium varium TaxID=856 RepID=UPI002430A007|nr:HU family DNA-binding protein [Fusobacterium varium]UYI80113.1 MAG: HU family DNA-binding protein [Fusobacterium varium]